MSDFVAVLVEGEEEGAIVIVCSSDAIAIDFARFVVLLYSCFCPAVAVN